MSSKNSNLSFYNSKYLKYKNKYLNLKLNQEGGNYFPDLLNLKKDDNKCCICLTSLLNNKKIVFLHCGHFLHDSCYLQRIQPCPMCRAPPNPFRLTLTQDQYNTLIKSMKDRLPILRFLKYSDPSFLDSINNVTNNYIHQYEATTIAGLEDRNFIFEIILPDDSVTIYNFKHDDNIVNVIEKTIDPTIQTRIVLINKNTNEAILDGLTPLSLLGISKLTVSLRIKTKIDVTKLMRSLYKLNKMKDKRVPISFDNFMENITFDNDGNLKDLNLKKFNLTKYPQNFGNLQASGNLNLSGNHMGRLPYNFTNIMIGGNIDLNGNSLEMLPDKFYNLSVVGDLNLSFNHFRVLPDTFSKLSVGGSLNLSFNYFRVLPDTFGYIKVGRDLNLGHCRLTNLPDSFKHIQIHGDLSLEGNSELVLPDIFENFSVGGSLNLSRCDMIELPETFGYIKVGGNLLLQRNRLVTLPESFKHIKIEGNLDLTYNLFNGAPNLTDIRVGGEIYLDRAK